jgi:hypothetical protein
VVKSDSKSDSNFQTKTFRFQGQFLRKFFEDTIDNCLFRGHENDNENDCVWKSVSVLEKVYTNVYLVGGYLNRTRAKGQHPPSSRDF